MKSMINRVYKLFTLNTDLPTHKVLSARSIRLLIWIRKIIKICLFLLGLYLIANFASLVRNMIMK
jgi:hypothetical protein